MTTLYRVGDYLNVEFTYPDEWQNQVQWDMAQEDLSNLGIGMKSIERGTVPFGCVESIEDLDGLKDEVWLLEEERDWTDDKEEVIELTERIAELEARKGEFLEFWINNHTYRVVVDVEQYRRYTGQLNVTEERLKDLVELYAAIAECEYYMVRLWEDDDEDLDEWFPVADWVSPQRVREFAVELGYTVGHHHKVELIEEA